MHVAVLNASSLLTVAHQGPVGCRQLFQLNIEVGGWRGFECLNKDEGNKVSYLSKLHPSEMNYICQTSKVIKIMYYFQCFIM